MGIFDDYGYFGKNDKRSWSEKIAGTRNKTAIAPSKASGGPGRLPESVISQVVRDNTDYGTGTRQGNDDIPESTYRDGPPPKSLMEQLMEQLSQSYQRPQSPQQPGGGGFELYMKSLDDALASKLGAIGGIRDTAQKNYQTSDANLASMFGSVANNIATQGSQRFADIANQNKQGIISTRDESLNRLQADQQNAANVRAAMLKSLGIEEAGAALDPNQETLQSAMTGITDRSNVASQGAEQAGATNQAYNQSVVNSVNQQGAERRAALTQQLGSIQNQLGMAEADAKMQHEQAKAQLQAKFQEAQANAAAADNEQDYKIWSDRQNLVFDLWKTLSQQEQEQTQAQDTKVQGFGGLAQDLLNQNIPQEQASQYIGALSQVVGGEYMKGIHPDEGYDRASIIARRLINDYNVPPVVATNLATNYSNLGSNAYYNAPGG
jgi:hypothetical protein